MNLETDQFNSQELKLQTAAQNHFESSKACVPADLFSKILFRLAYEQEQSLIKKLKYQLFGSVVFFAAALSSLVLAVKTSILSNSTSLKFISLAFTDFGAVLHNWKDYSFSVLETLPLDTMAFVIGALLATVLFGEFVISRWRGFRNIQHGRQAL
jgi:hypothetical protein